MSGYENLLAIVYHETVPIWGQQHLSMQIFTVDSQRESKNQIYSLPIKPQSTLRWFGFSQEGMIISQDSMGGLRAFNLATKIWSNFQVEQLPYSRRVWIVGMVNYKLKYWKTTEL
jgi:chromosome transmission fidelity protein 4